MYSAFSRDLTAKTLRMARDNKGSHRFTCYPHVYPQMESTILPLLPSRSASPHFGWYSFPDPKRVRSCVGLDGRLLTKMVCQLEAHPSTNRPMVPRPVIELMAIESQLRKYDAVTTRSPVCAYACAFMSVLSTVRIHRTCTWKLRRLPQTYRRRVTSSSRMEIPLLRIPHSVVIIFNTLFLDPSRCRWIYINQ